VLQCFSYGSFDLLFRFPAVATDVARSDCCQNTPWLENRRVFEMKNGEVEMEWTKDGMN
jgi:hypothetical protein